MSQDFALDLISAPEESGIDLLPRETIGPLGVRDGLTEIRSPQCVSALADAAEVVGTRAHNIAASKPVVARAHTKGNSVLAMAAALGAVSRSLKKKAPKSE